MPRSSGSARVEQESASLRKELGLPDLVLTQILYVVGLSWVGAAAKLGTSQIPFWLAAMALFYLPQAAVVVYLSRRFPLEGGLYQWAKLGLNGGIAFLVGWNLWLYAIVLLGAFGLSVANAIVYAIGPSAEWLSGNHVFIGAVTGILLGALIVVSILGLGVSKWVHNAGAVLLLAAFAFLLILPLINVARGTLRAYHPLTVTAPALTLLNLNIFGKLAVGALSGFEYVAVLAGEARDAKRTIAKSVIIAAPIIALMFILGTSAVQALVPPGQIDLVGPIPQAFRMGLGSSGIAAIVIPFAVMAVSARTIANSSVLFTATTRMPMVAGWDRLIPGMVLAAPPEIPHPRELGAVHWRLRADLRGAGNDQCRRTGSIPAARQRRGHPLRPDVSRALRHSCAGPRPHRRTRAALDRRRGHCRLRDDRPVRHSVRAADRIRREPARLCAQDQ